MRIPPPLLAPIAALLLLAWACHDASRGPPSADDAGRAPRLGTSDSGGAVDVGPTEDVRPRRTDGQSGDEATPIADADRDPLTSDGGVRDLSDDEPTDSGNGSEVNDLADAGDAADTDIHACAPRPPPDTTGPWMVVGTGLTEYVALDNCDHVPIVQGIQGGYHVWGALRAGGFALEPNAFVRLTLELVDDGHVVARTDYEDILPRDGGDYEYLGVTVVFVEEGGFDPTAFLGRPLLLRARVQLEGAVDVSDAVVVVPNEIRS
jgi:hypothetical protein